MTSIEFTIEHGLLGKRSSKILGGYVTENMLLDTFMTQDFVFTKSWWFSKVGQQVFWFVEKPELSRLDLNICERLKQKGNDCFQLFLEAAEWKIRELPTGSVRTIDEFVADHSLKKIYKKPSTDDITEHERQMLIRCMEYYREQELLEDIHRSIQIEDKFLNQYFYTSNVDMFLAQGTTGALEPVCLEIKFKDAFTHKGKDVLGVEHYQLQNVCKALEEAGIKVYVVVLYDSCRDREHVKSTNIFRYLESGAQREWIYARISTKASYWEYTMQSKRTGFTGTPPKARPVYCIPKENFDPLTSLQDLTESDKLLDSDGTQVWLCPRCGKRLRLKNGPYGAFWGCNFPACKYTKKA